MIVSTDDDKVDGGWRCEGGHAVGKGLNELLCASWGIGQGDEYPTIKKK